MKLSIIIPCYNEQNTILELLSLVKNNSYKDIEIIVVDDNSNDNTENLIRELSKKDSRVRLISRIDRFGL